AWDRPQSVVGLIGCSVFLSTASLRVARAGPLQDLAAFEQLQSLSAQPATRHVASKDAHRVDRTPRTGLSDCSVGSLLADYFPAPPRFELRRFTRFTLLIIQVVNQIHPALRKWLVQDRVIPSMECGPEELDDRRLHLRHGVSPMAKCLW